MAETMVASSVKTDHSSRKNKKPLMEKRRRARINSCLSQLKSLVLQAIKKDSSQFSKLEKADILELTVKHLRALQRQQAVGALSQDSHVVSKYRAGFNECAKEVVRYMGSVREVNEDVKERVVSHLAGCLQVVNQITPMETLQQQQHQHQQQALKPLHVHIPAQQPLSGGTVAPSVIMHTAAVAQATLPSSGLGFTPSPLRPASSSPSSSSSPQDCHQTPSSPSSLPPAPLTALSAVAMTTAPTPTTAVSPPASASSSSSLPGAVSGAFKLVPSGAGAVAVYVGTAPPDGVPRAPEAVSVDAVPLYSVALPPPPPPHHHHHHHHPASTSAAALTAFVTPPRTTSHVTSPLLAAEPRYENVSPVKAEQLGGVSSLPVDLRQAPKVRSVEDCAPCSALTASSHALADDKLWRPW